MNFAQRISKHRFLLLLVALSLLLTLYPLERWGGRRSTQVCFESVLLAGLFAMRRSWAWFLSGVVLVAPSVVVFWGSVVSSGSSPWRVPLLEGVGDFTTALYLVLLITFILRDIFSSTKVTGDRLCGALSIYLLMGVAWGFLYTGLELHAPGSFVFGAAFEPVYIEVQPPLYRSSALFYFSFITLTTLGYGDISPVGSTAQMFTMWEAIIGQAYLSILVARLVGLHVSAERPNGAQNVVSGARLLNQTGGRGQNIDARC